MGAVSSAVEFVGDVVGGAMDAVDNVVDDVSNVVSDVGSQVDDFVNEEIPGGWITVGLAGAGAAGAFDELLGAESSISSDAIAAANATDDPIAALNALEGWTYSDPAYLEAIGAGADIIDAGMTANAEFGNEGWNGTGEGPGAFGGVFDDYNGFLLGAGAGLIGSELLGGGLFGGKSGGGGGGTVPPTTVPPVRPIQSVNGSLPSQVPKYADVPNFNFKFSDVPIDYFQSSQLMPTDAKFLGVQPGVDYDSELIKSLQDDAAGLASANNGFTVYQVKAK